MHVAILGGALLSIQSRQELRLPETEPVAVGMISPGEVTKVRQGVRTAKLLEAEPKESPKGDLAKKEAARPKQAAAAPPPPPPAAQEEKAKPPEPKAADPPSAASAAEAQKKAQEAQQRLEAEQQKQAEAQRLAEEKKRAEEQAKAEAAQRAEAQKLAEEKKRTEEEQKLADERKRAEEQKRLEEQRKQAEVKKRKDEEKKRREAALKKKREEAKKRQEEMRRQEAEAAAKAKQFDADKISALLNKVPDKAAPAPASAPPDQPTKAKGPTLGAAEGRDKLLSAGEKAMLKAEISGKIRRCWKIPSAGGGTDTPAVKLRWRLNPDGTLDGEPKVLDPRPDPLFRLAAEAALRAVRACEPFDFLPPESYDGWRIITWEFDPSKML
jgi:colicin import membrane protein